MPATLRSHIFELRSIGWSYAHIAAKHGLPKLTVATTCKRETEHVDNASCPWPECSHVITEEMRDQLYDTAVNIRPRITYRELRDLHCPGVSIRHVQNAFSR